MKQRVLLSILFCSCAALALTVMAGPESVRSGKEMKQVAPAPLPECNWTGFYLGLNVGGQFGHSEDLDLDDYNFAGQSWGYHESGIVTGGQLGYNWQWRWLVLGAEADLGYMNLDGRAVQPAARTANDDTVGSTDSDFYTTIRGRLGVAFNSWLIYGTGGAIGVNYEQRLRDDCDNLAAGCGLGLIDADKQDFDWGYTVGGGVEKMFGCHWSIKSEYLYYSLDTRTFSGVETGPVPAFGDTFRFRGETTGHIVRGGLNYKF
jgi:outer membrane immunogenic protein